MVTIVDAGAVLGPSYCSRLEAHYQSQRDGHRSSVFSGPLNTYRNFADASCLTQMYELSRCHDTVFYVPGSRYEAQSNFSIPLGLVAELNFFAPEEPATDSRPLLKKYGKIKTLPIEPMICSDMSTNLSQQYQQAVAQHWGITQFTQRLKHLRHAPLSLEAWRSLLSECTSSGSFLRCVLLTASYTLLFLFVGWLAMNYDLIPRPVKTYLYMMYMMFTWKWAWFWIVEYVFWMTLLRKFPIKRPDAKTWAWLVAVSSVTPPFVLDIIFEIMPTLDCLYFMAFSFGLPRSGKRGKLGQISQTPRAHDARL